MDTETGKMTWTQLWLPIEGADAAPALLITGGEDSYEEWAEEDHSIPPVVWKDAQMFYTVMAMFDFEADRRGWALTEVRFQRKEEGRVLAIMKASKGKRRVVAFIEGQTFFDCWKAIQETKRTEGFEWKPDRYAKF